MSKWRVPLIFPKVSCKFHQEIKGTLYADITHCGLVLPQGVTDVGHLQTLYYNNQ